MLIYKYINSINTVSQSGSINTPVLKGGLCRKIIVEAGTSTTSFDFSIKDDRDTTTRTYDNIDYKLDDEYVFPIEGENTFTVSGASADGQFNVTLWVQE